MCPGRNVWHILTLCVCVSCVLLCRLIGKSINYTCAKLEKLTSRKCSGRASSILMGYLKSA